MRRKTSNFQSTRLRIYRPPPAADGHLTGCFCAACLIGAALGLLAWYLVALLTWRIFH